MAHENGRISATRVRTRDPDIPPWAEALARLLDSAFVIPGTNIRVGLDPILGFIAPGAGDAASAFASATLLWVAFQLRVPKLVLFRMVVNVAIDALIGAVPLLGDLFDLAFRAAEKNLALVRKYAAEPRRQPGLSDYLVFGVCILGVLCLLALPVVTGVLLIHLFTTFSGG